jgi:hypothetical protein
MTADELEKRIDAWSESDDYHWSQPLNIAHEAIAALRLLERSLAHREECLRRLEGAVTDARAPLLRLLAEMGVTHA